MARRRRGGRCIRPERKKVAAAGDGEHKARGKQAGQDGRRARPELERHCS
jgi:hypothetical protein